jgi:hypothetical protein
MNAVLKGTFNAPLAPVQRENPSESRQQETSSSRVGQIGFTLNNLRNLISSKIARIKVHDSIPLDLSDFDFETPLRISPLIIEPDPLAVNECPENHEMELAMKSDTTQNNMYSTMEEQGFANNNNTIELDDKPKSEPVQNYPSSLNKYIQPIEFSFSHIHEDDNKSRFYTTRRIVIGNVSKYIFPGITKSCCGDDAFTKSTFFRKTRFR